MAHQVLHKANTRGYANHGWLEARHSFSFANWYNPDRIQFGTLRVLNDDIVAPARGFSMHPHDNMEIITIPLEGRLKHRDSMGNEGVFGKNEVQVMSAGTGVLHSEVNPDMHEAVKLFQIWIFPNKRNVAPRYAQKAFDSADRQGKFQCVVAPLTDTTETEALGIHQDAWLSLGSFSANSTTTYTLRRPENGVYFLLINGEAVINDTPLSMRDAVGIWDTETVEISFSTDAEILVLDVPMV